MPDLSSSSGRMPLNGSDRLDSWKEIAAYLRRGVTTVQRWELDGLPIHRLPHARKGSVFAFRSEIDEWMVAKARASSGDPTAEVVVAGPYPGTGTSAVSGFRSGSRNRRAILPITGLVLVVGWGLYLVGGSAASPIVEGVAAITPTPIAVDLESETGPSLSPDGSQVLYFWQRPNSEGLYIKPLGGSPRPVPLVGMSGGSASFPTWSPSGDLIGFLVLERPDRRALFVVSPDGGTPRYVASIDGTGVCWTPDGGTVAFADRSSTGEPLAIFAINLATGQRRRLTTPAPGSFGDTRCAFSPDGRRLAVARFPTRYESDVYVVAVDGEIPESPQRLTMDFEGISGLAWAPDGRSIVITSSTGLWVLDPERSPRERPAVVLRSGSIVASPSFSRTLIDGAPRLAFEQRTAAVNLWRWNGGPGEQGVTRRFEASTRWDDNPAFSPDGRTVAFVSNRTGSPEIWTADAVGGGARQITSQGGPIGILPRWSPDGRRIVFSSRVGGNRDLYLTNPDGSNTVRLTSEPSQEEFPSWSGDGRWIYFRSDRTGRGQIWKIRAAGGPPQQVTTGDGSQGLESPDGRLLFFVRGVDSPGVWSVPVNGGEEVLVQPDAREGEWGVSDSGIVWVHRTGTAAKERVAVRLLDLRDGTTRTLVKVPDGMFIRPGFAVSRDARQVIWTVQDVSKSDVFMVDRWDVVGVIKPSSSSP